MSSRFKEFLAKSAAVSVFGLLYFTYRFKKYGRDHEAAGRKIHPKAQICIAIWHRNSIASLLSLAWSRLAILVSQSFDGEIIAFVGRAFGVHSARGSSTRGGSEALRELLRLNKEGYDIGITVDGPTGPLYKVKPGIIAIAARGGTPIVPYAAIPRRAWVLNKSWDKFRVPKPFSEIVCVYGEPILVDKRLDSAAVEALAARVEAALMELEKRVEIAIDKGEIPQAF